MLDALALPQPSTLTLSTARAAFITALSRRWMQRVGADAGALRSTLAAYRDTESSGEAQAFPYLLPHLPPRLARLAQRHAADEARHAAGFEALLDAHGGAPDLPPPPEPLAMMDAAAGGVLVYAGRDAESTGRALLLLMALERRFVERLPVVAPVAPVAPDAARLMRQVTADELNHVRWCAAMSRAVVPDPARWKALRDELVAVEARTFPLYLFAFTDYILYHHLAQMPAAERALFRGVCRLGRALGTPMPVVETPALVTAERGGVR